MKQNPSPDNQDLVKVGGTRLDLVSHYLAATVEVQIQETISKSKHLVFPLRFN